LRSRRGRCCTFSAAPFDPVEVSGLLAIGDSKTDIGNPNPWSGDLVAEMNAADNPERLWFRTAFGASGQSSQYWVDNIASFISTHRDNYRVILYQIGVNEFNSTNQSTWIANVLFVLDAMHERWPGALMYLSKPWKCLPNGAGTCTADAVADQYGGWVDQIVAARPSFVFAGDDERAWFKPNYLSYSDDTGSSVGLHFYAPTGQARKVLEMKAVLGY
jgi:hypothetical protein